MVLKKANVEIDRRILADIAMHDAAAFTAITEKKQKLLWHNHSV